MQWLVFAETINGVLIISGNYLVATGRPRLFALLCWGNLVLLLPALLFAGMQWGITGIVLARVVTSLLYLPVVIFFTARAAEQPLRKFAAALWRPSFAGLVMAAVLSSIRSFIPPCGSPSRFLSASPPTYRPCCCSGICPAVSRAPRP